MNQEEEKIKWTHWYNEISTIEKQTAQITALRCIIIIRENSEQDIEGAVSKIKSEFDV